MEPNQPNQSIDGVRPAAASQPASAPSAPAPAETTTEIKKDPNVKQSVFDDGPAVAAKPKPGKGIKVMLFIFILLFTLAAGGAGYLYMNLNGRIEAEQQKVQQAEDSAKKQNEKLKTENEALQAINKAQTSQVTSLTTTAQQLKTKCGRTCDTIAFPPTAN